MENPSAQKLIHKIQLDLFKNGFNIETLIEDLKKLRTYAMDEQNPIATKAIRLTYEHLEENGAFLIPIPEDEPLEDEQGDGTSAEKTMSNENNLESLDYLLSLFTDLKNKNNMLDLKEYNKAFLAF